MRRFFRELFAREKVDDPDFREVDPAEHPPSIYDSLIERLECELALANDRIGFHKDRVEDYQAEAQHAREQLAVLRAHREEERAQDKLAADARKLEAFIAPLGSDPVRFAESDWDAEKANRDAVHRLLMGTYGRGLCSCVICRQARGEEP